MFRDHLAKVSLVPGPLKGTAARRRRAAVSQHAGQQLTNGAQAETYANHFIAVHLNEIGGGKTYSQLSAESLADPGNAKLKAQVESMFQGTTLRGLLLSASYVKEDFTITSEWL